MHHPRRFRLLAILLLIVALFLLLKQRFSPSSDSGHGSGVSAATGNGAAGLSTPPTSTGSRDVRGRLTSLDEGTSSFNAYLEQYRSLTNSMSRRQLLREMISEHGRMFGPQILELIQSFEPPAEARNALLHLGMLHASEDLSIHAYALERFPEGKDRSALIGAALTHFPLEKIGPFLTTMESSSVEGDIKESARLIAEQHVLGRPDITDEQLQHFIDEVHSPELRAALLTEAAERPKRGQPAPAIEQEE